MPPLYLVRTSEGRLRGAHGGAGGRAGTSRAGSSTEGEEVGGDAASEADEYVAVEGAEVVGRRHEVVPVGICLGCSLGSRLADHFASASGGGYEVGDRTPLRPPVVELLK